MRTILSSRHTKSHGCTIRQLLITLACCIVYLNCGISVKRTLSFSFNARHKPAFYGRPNAKQRLRQQFTSNPKSSTHVKSKNNIWHLNAIALPPTSASDSKLMDIVRTSVNGYSSSTKQQQQPNIGVLLLNLGGPETGDDVEGTIDTLVLVTLCALIFISN
jgi:hypothetical protein